MKTDVHPLQSAGKRFFWFAISSDWLQNRLNVSKHEDMLFGETKKRKPTTLTLRGLINKSSGLQI